MPAAAKPQLYAAPLLGAAKSIHPPAQEAAHKKGKKKQEPTPPGSDSETPTPQPKPKRVLSDETKAKLKAARQAKAEAKRQEAAAAAAAQRQALDDATRRAAAAQLKKQEAAERRRQKRMEDKLLKEGLDAALGPSDDAATTPTPSQSKGKGKGKRTVAPLVAPPATPSPPAKRTRRARTTSTAQETDPPAWFLNYVTDVLAEDHEQQGLRPGKQVAQQAQEVAKTTWGNGPQRQQCQKVMDTARQDLFTQIFGKRPA